MWVSRLAVNVLSQQWKSGYRQQQAAVFLQSPHEAQEGHAGDDDADDYDHAGYVELGEAGGERGNPEVYQQVDAKAQHDHAENLTREQLMSANAAAAAGPEPCRLRTPQQEARGKVSGGSSCLLRLNSV